MVTITIGDAAFETTPRGEASAEQNAVAYAELARSGFPSLGRFEAIADDTERTLALAGAICGSERFFELLAALFRQKGGEWRRADMAATADLFRHAKGPEAFEKLMEVAGAAVIGFFGSGTSSSPTSPTVSPQAAKTAAPTSSSALRAETTANGTESSEPLPETTPIGASRSRGGRSVKRSSPTASTSARAP